MVTEMWICCQCGDGPKVYKYQPRCVTCNHFACGGIDIPNVCVNACIVGQLLTTPIVISAPQHYHPDASLPGCTKADLETYKQDWLFLRESFGEEHGDTLCVGFRIAKALAQGKRHELALGWYRYVYLAEIEQLGKDHPKVLEVRHAIADVLTSLGRVADARRWRHDESSGCRPVK
ncbi:hypothetical protein BDV18DRAFT_35704 [Aspergillus unguis]